MKKYIFPLLILFAIIMVVGCARVANTNDQINPAPGTLLSISVSPESTSISLGSTQQFAALGVVATGAVTITPSWEVIGGVGTIDAIGLFRATSIGTGTVEARLGEVVGRAQIEITPRTISGYVYDTSLSNFVTGVMAPLQNVNIYIGDRTTVTDSTGYFSVSGITNLENIITATEDNHVPVIMITEQDQAKIYMNLRTGITIPAGASYIQGQISGIPASTISSLNVSAYSYENGRYSYGSYNSSTKHYSISNAPDNGETYISATYSTNEASCYKSFFTYNKINMIPGTAEANLAFGTNAININLVIPSGYSSKYANINLIKGRRTIVVASALEELKGKTSFALTNIPDLLAGDSLALQLSLSYDGSNAESFRKYIYNISETVDYDFSTMPIITYIDPTPAEGSIVTDEISIAWTPLDYSNVQYWIIMYDYATGKQIFNALTNSCNLAIPAAFTFISGKTYAFYIYGIVADSFEVEDISPLYKEMLFDIVVFSTPRKFVGNYVGSSALSLGAKVEGYVPGDRPYTMFDEMLRMPKSVQKKGADK